MFTVTIQLTSISAERLSENLPPKIQFNVNLAVPSGSPYRRNNNQYTVPFTFTVNSNPPVVQIILKGNAILISQDKKEIDRIDNDIKNKRIPSSLIQAIFTNMIAESIILSRSLGTPPPIPGLPQPSQQVQSRFKGGQPPDTVI